MDEDAFKKMVERQFEVMRRDRLRQLEEPKVSAPKPEEVVSANAGAPSAPNTTIRPNEVDKPDTAEVRRGCFPYLPELWATTFSSGCHSKQVLQPMEAEKVAEEQATVVTPADTATLAGDKKPEPMETTTAVPVATPSPVETIRPASEENTSENMDIEPPTEAASHSSHPTTTQTTTTTATTTNKPPSSDIVSVPAP